MSVINVTKRAGQLEPLDFEKIHRVLEWASNSLTGISISEVELRANLQLYDGIPSDDIHELLIKSSSELISESTPNYQFLAARLVNYKLRKEVYGQYEPWALSRVIDINVGLGVYDDQILVKYTSEEINKLDSFIRHARDDEFTYVAMEQMRGKYLVQNRNTETIYETPQILYMMVAATLFSNYPEDTRMRYVKDFYDATSQFFLSLPTPIMGGVRTSIRQFSSCVLIESGDSLDSISATSSAVVKYISKKAGIGIGAGRIRALGSSIGDGSTVHTGQIPFLKLFQASVKSCSQGGIRGGAATTYLPIWHREFEELVVLKNNKGTDENRVRNMDYAFQFNKLMYERLLTGGNITMFCPNDVPDLYDAFYSDQDLFAELYVKYENDKTLKTKTMKAMDVFVQFLSERKDTGRIYLMNVDHANTHGSFLPEAAPIRMSNLCAEVTLPTKPLDNINDPDGEISLCTLAAINWGLINHPSEFAKYSDLIVRALDELLDYQDYPVIAAENSTMNRRPLGNGIINLAYFLAKRGLKYNAEALPVIDEYAEAWSYSLIKASADLAIEKGKIPLNNETKYGLGILPIDTYKKDVDELVPHIERMDWSSLREQLKEHGIRNSTLMALMPAETSAQISNSTNGIEPPRALVSHKQSKDGIMAQVVPGYHKLKNKYDLLWDQENPEGYLQICAVLQKYIDQGISVNTSYNPEKFPDGKVPMSRIIKDVISFYKYGGKQLYYNNTFDSAGEIESEDEDCADGACKI
jgi:ribonucleoside-diphosphate reductase alpha chain